MQLGKCAAHTNAVMKVGSSQECSYESVANLICKNYNFSKAPAKPLFDFLRTLPFEGNFAQLTELNLGAVRHCSVMSEVRDRFWAVRHCNERG